MKKSKKYPAGGLRKESARKVYPPFSRGGPKRGNPTMTTSTTTARRKGDPQHYVEGDRLMNRQYDIDVNIYIYIYRERERQIYTDI